MKIKRREFLNQSILSIAFALNDFSFLMAQNNELLSKVKPRESFPVPLMKYRRLGQTNLKVSEIGYGGAMIENKEVLNKAIDLGINYIDTAPSYQEGKSEEIFGEVLKKRRNEVYVATKFNRFGKREKKDLLISQVEGSLKRLHTDMVDVIIVHEAQDKNTVENEDLYEAFYTLKKTGKVRFLGISAHSGNQSDILSHAVKSGHFDVLLFKYNYFDHQGLDNLFSLCRAKDIGIMTMKSLAFGAFNKLQMSEIGKGNVVKAMIKWVLRNDFISSLISQMVNFNQLSGNVSVVGSKFSQSDEKLLDMCKILLAYNYCNMCRKCEEICPEGLPIADIMRYKFYFENYGAKNTGVTYYRELNKNSNECKDCGQCENECPKKIPIRTALKESHLLMG